MARIVDRERRRRRRRPVVGDGAAHGGARRGGVGREVELGSVAAEVARGVVVGARRVLDGGESSEPEAGAPDGVAHLGRPLAPRPAPDAVVLAGLPLLALGLAPGGRRGGEPQRRLSLLLCNGNRVLLGVGVQDKVGRRRATRSRCATHLVGGCDGRQCPCGHLLYNIGRSAVHNGFPNGANYTVNLGEGVLYIRIFRRTCVLLIYYIIVRTM
jgi:hypothetical protein